MTNQNDTAENKNASEYVIEGTNRNGIKTWIYRAVCILMFVSGILFFTVFLIKYQYIITLHYPILSYMDYISTIVIAAMLIALICFLRTFKKDPAIKIVALIVAGVLLAASWYIYFRYFPKYGYLDACAIVKADSKYASATIEPHYRLYSEVKDNPFCQAGYILDVISDGKVIKWIGFDSTTGEYEFYEPED